MPSSVRRVSAGKISTPSLSTIACTVSLFQHILNHGFFQCCTDAIIAFTKNNFLNQVSMVDIAVRTQCAYGAMR